MAPGGNGFGQGNYDDLFREVSAWGGRHRSLLTKAAVALAILLVAGTSYY